MISIQKCYQILLVQLFIFIILTFSVFVCWKILSEQETDLFFEAPLLHCHPKKINTLKSSFLGMDSHPMEFILYPLKDHLRAEIYPIKPFCMDQSRFVAFYLEGKNEKIELSERQLGYLLFQNDSLSFSSKPTKFGFFYEFVDEKIIKIQMQCNLEEFSDNEIRVVGENEFYLEGKALYSRQNQEMNFPEYEKFIWLGKDLILEKLSISENPSRIKISNEIYPTKKGDVFIYQYDWSPFQPMGEESNLPILQVREISVESLKGYFWESNQLRAYPITIHRFEFFNTKDRERLFKPLRIKRKKKILFSLEKQSFISEEGCWAIKLGNKWEVVSNQEILKIFSRQKSFEAFYIKKINTESPQSVAIEYYNMDHSQCISTQMPIQERCKSRRLRLPRKISKFPRELKGSSI